MKKSTLLTFVMFALLATNIAMGADAGKQGSKKTTLPDIKTFVVMPPEIENVCVWVTADKIGPLINRSCRTKGNCSYSMSLPADVRHDKDVRCPDVVARLLAQTVSALHIDVLPLTIFNGWQWEYSYSMAGYDAKVYDLSARGGSWEDCSEAVYIKTFGRVFSGWISPARRTEGIFTNTSVSNIIVETFTNLRTRNGYPRQRQL
jgi:hypothetical protein